MNAKDFYNAKHAYFSLAHALGTNGRKQNLLVTCLHDIEQEIKDNSDKGHKETLLRMNSIFHDGLAYDNWPWIKNGIDMLPDVDVVK